jgi:hypothetical protein
MNLLLNDGEGAAILYVEKFGEYGIPVLDGGTSYIILDFCPWCGAKLPISKRDTVLEDA